MVNKKCKARNPITCRVHGLPDYVELVEDHTISYFAYHSFPVSRKTRDRIEYRYTELVKQFGIDTSQADSIVPVIDVMLQEAIDSKNTDEYNIIIQKLAQEWGLLDNVLRAPDLPALIQKYSIYQVVPQIFASMYRWGTIQENHEFCLDVMKKLFTQLRAAEYTNPALFTDVTFEKSKYHLDTGVRGVKLTMEYLKERYIPSEGMIQVAPDSYLVDWGKHSDFWFRAGTSMDTELPTEVAAVIFYEELYQRDTSGKYSVFLKPLLESSTYLDYKRERMKVQDLPSSWVVELLRGKL